MYKLPYLQKYKGKSTRYKCPSCGRLQSFTLYLDGNSHEPIHRTVGRCNREIKCGYHYTPKQYFTDNPLTPSLSPPLRGGWEGFRVGVRSTPLRQPTVGRVGSGVRLYPSNKINVDLRATPSPLERAGVRSIPFSYVEKSASYKSNFVRFLCEFLTTEQMTYIGDNYALGATKNKEVIFWQIDINGKVRTGKIMQYNAITGKRLKHESGAIDWVHNKLKKSGALLEAFNLQQCFFGEHLLTLYPDKSVAIVESEKSAIIASSLIPNMIWLAAGNINGLSVEKCKVLKNRNVILYPDLGAFEKWCLKTEELQEQCNCKITVSTLLEDESTDTDRTNGLDIADYIIEEMKTISSQRQIQSRFTHDLEQMIVTNPALLILIDKLQLVQI